MDYKKIFLEDACPTPIGGQAIMDGVMMRGTDRIAMAMRLPSDEIYLRTKPLDPPGKASGIPIIRGVVAFVKSLTIGMTTLTESADILEHFMEADTVEAPGKFESFLNDKFGERGAWNVMLIASVVFAIVISVLGFVIFPTVVVSALGKVISNSIVLNLIEGVFRILLFIAYVALIARMEEIKTVFQYHGAEHKSIHCFENGKELTPENAREFYRLHPRCGTSFLMFVMIISLLLFSLLGWPNLAMRIISRLLLIPVIAGLSYELLRWAGRSDNAVVRVLSYPGLLMQELTTRDPDDKQLEIAIVSLKAVLVDKDAPFIEGIVDTDANLIREVNLDDPDSVAGVKEEEPEEKMTQEEKRHMWSNMKSHRYSEDVTNVGNLVAWGQSCLAMIENGKNEAIDIFCYVMGYTKTDIIIRKGEILSKEDAAEYERLINKRLSGTPLQYITGVQEFMGLLFRVNRNVLIPRLDTEVLAEQAVGLLKGKNWQNPKVLDMCTGSGVLGVTIAHEIEDAEVTMTDISNDALSTAMSNAQINDVHQRCTFLAGDMFKALPEDAVYNMIISNPPYIESEVIESLDVEVKDHEPRLALDGGADGLDYYRLIAIEAPAHLEAGGLLALEIGYNQGEAVKRLLEDTGCFGTVTVLKDLNGLDRVVITEKSAN